MKKFLFWFGVFAMSMLVMVQPAQAVEQVAPASGAPAWYSGSVTPDQLTPEAACRRYIVYYNQTLTHEFLSVSSPLYSGGRPYYALCNHRRLSDGASGAAIGSPSLSNRIGTAPVCPVATPVYTFNAVTSMCERAEPACPAAGTQHSKGFFNIGTVPTGKLLNSACVSGCKIDLISGYAPAAKQKINAIYYYFGNAEYKHVGTSCTPDTPNFLSDFVGALPSATCAAGQQMISMDGVTKCFNSTGAEVDANSASAVAAAKTLADAKTAKAIQDAKDAVAAAGGSASDVAAAGTVAAGVSAAQSGGASNTGFSPDDPMNAFCIDNPQAQICKDQVAGEKTVGTPALDSLYVEGDLIAGKTVSSVIGGFKTRVLASGVGSAIGGFFTVNQAAGTCPVWSVNAPLIGSLTFDFYCQSTFQNLLPWIRSVLLLIFSVIAFRIAVL